MCERRIILKTSKDYVAGAEETKVSHLGKNIALPGQDVSRLYRGGVGASPWRLTCHSVNVGGLD